jgi:16S rRNA (uracil1498-N3)-methyltransferase
MGAPRFFAPVPLDRSAVGHEIELPDEVAHHALRVLRLREGDPIVLFDGCGGEYAATLAAAGKRGARARLDRFDDVERESPNPVTLVQAVIASDPMEFVVRKAVELGAAAIVPVFAARSQGPLASEKRLLHWRAVAASACEQCGRNRVPPIASPIPFLEWLRATPGDDGTRVLLGPGAERSLASVVRRAERPTLLIGPEGGWTREEIAAAVARGVLVAHLGLRVLRVETAAIAALATFNAIAGDAR